MSKRRPSFADHCPPELITDVNGFPAPPAPDYRPLHAVASVIKLLSNKEDTRQVFEIMNAVNRDHGSKLFDRFTASEYGRRVVSEPIKVEEVFCDRQRLRAMDKGSLGRVYLDFMEGENLTPDGILDAAEEAGIDYRCETQFEEFRRMILHLEVNHDLWHVLTGYGRDALGEICNLAFTQAQTGNPGLKVIINIGRLAAKAEKPGQPIFDAVTEARELGERTEWLLGQDVEALLPLPLEEVRERLNMTEPVIYNSIPDEVKATILKPRIKKTQSQREGAVVTAH